MRKRLFHYHLEKDDNGTEKRVFAFSDNNKHKSLSKQGALIWRCLPVVETTHCGGSKLLLLRDFE